MNGLIKALALGSRGRLEDAMEVWNLIQPERNSLNRLKRISIRNKSWFRMLSWEQRRFIDAIITMVKRIRSLLLLKILAPIVMKLLNAVGKGNALRGALALMDEASYRMMRDAAQNISRIAQNWGNKLAHKWLEDVGFLKYLTVMSLPQNRNLPAFTIPNYRSEI